MESNFLVCRLLFEFVVGFQVESRSTRDSLCSQVGGILWLRLMALLSAAGRRDICPTVGTPRSDLHTGSDGQGGNGVVWGAIFR